MIRALLSLLFIAFILEPALAESSVRTVEVEGTGTTREEAIRNGLLEAIKQVKGVRIESNLTGEQNLAELRVTQYGEPDLTITLSEQSQGSIQEKTRGLVQTYQVLESSMKSEGNWSCLLSVAIADYKAPGHSPESLLKLVVLPFRLDPKGDQGSNMEVPNAFSDKLVKLFTHSRKFSVLDRAYMAEYLGEKRLINSSDGATDEQIKLGQVLGADYLVVGKMSDIGLIETPYNISLTGERGVRREMSVSCSYRITVMATRQVKWADEIKLTLGDDKLRELEGTTSEIKEIILGQLAETLVDQALRNIFPIRVINITGNSVILNMGGKGIVSGDRFRVFGEGESMVDPNTGESLGGAELELGTIEITRVTDKLSYGKVVDGSTEDILVGSVCRRVNAL